MLNFGKSFGCLLLFFLPTYSIGQVDSVLALPLAEIVSQPIRFLTAGTNSQSWLPEDHRQYSHTNLADGFRQMGGLFIKSYGNGSIATTSIRGGSAGHTSVLWNGLPIQNPMLGQLDFSLFPIAFIDKIQLHYGGNSAAWGSGAIGGVIRLENLIDLDTTSRGQFQSTIGSFGLFDQQFQYSHNNGRWGFHTRFFHRQAKNDFPYKLRPDLPEKTQTNAAFQQNGLLQSLQFKPGDNQTLAVFLWVQGSEREIPPTTVQNQSLASQADEFIRTAVHWKIIRPNIVWQTRFGLFRETIDYRDDLIQLSTFSGFWTAQAEAEGTVAWKDRQMLHFGITHSWITAHADAYEMVPQQNRTAPFLSYRYRLGSWDLQFNLRQELVDGRFLPLVPGAGLSFRLNKWLILQTKISRNYRLPTLNDLYWQPGGNPDLLSESGWSQEGGLHLVSKNRNHQINYRFTVFNRNIKNWILWSRSEGQNFWSSSNIAEVWSRGLEQRFNWTLASTQWNVGLSAGFDLIFSTNEVALDNPKLDKGAQLVYVPREQGFGSFAIHWKKLGLRYRHTYTGAVSSINNGTLAAYHLGYLDCYIQLDRPKWGAGLFFNINNLWDTDYRVIERQPMPGRNFQIGLQFQIQKKNKRL